MCGYLRGIVLGAAALVGGCNQPAVALKPFAFQESANTFRDWDRVAHRIATEMVVRGLLPGDGMLFPQLYIHLVRPDATFLREASHQLQSDILHAGGQVARSPAGASVINLDVDFVKWSPRDKPPGAYFSALGAAAGTSLLLATTLPDGTAVHHHGFGAGAARMGASDALLASGAGIIAAGLITDTLIALTPTMNAEAIWEASIVSPDRVLFDIREPIYIREGDIPFYYGNVQLAQVPSPGPPALLASRRIRLDP